MFGNYLFILCMLVATCHALHRPQAMPSNEEHSLLPVSLPAPQKLELKNHGYRRKPFNFGFNYKFCEMFLCQGFTITKLKKCAEANTQGQLLSSLCR
ncbi:hypothetical protein CDAR_492391 [Caerostris darwini]|uniref:Uncharacterized protein n=1 Tax=Caerostris darwini TaxID=1538125 RepID=A0AAV4UZG7_9ARAC|nr:hypothetical protein CDAR_492391 [Caerostris darwini]